MSVVNSLDTTKRILYLRKGVGVEEGRFGGSPKVTIEKLPDEVLLEIFQFYVEKSYMEQWVTLVHVCQGWRSVVFASPRRLHLCILFKGKTPARKMQEIWPTLPIFIWPRYYGESWQAGIAGNAIAVLERRDHICGISLVDVPSSILGKFVTKMQHPFPALKTLKLWCRLTDEAPPVLPDSFLDGSAHQLTTLALTNVIFPALWNLLLSTKYLLSLSLIDIPNPGYIQPEEMVIFLSSLTWLEAFQLGYSSPRSRPSRATLRLPPVTPTVLPVLRRLSFRGVSEYLEDFMAKFDTPLLDYVHITFFNQLVFNTSQLPQFISRSNAFERLSEAHIMFFDDSVGVDLSQRVGKSTRGRLVLVVKCTRADWQVSAVAQICSLLLPVIPTLERLRINSPFAAGKEDIEHGQWLELLYPFTTVENLYLREEVGLRVGTALQELSGESVTQVLPAIRSLYVEGLQPSGPTWETIEPFVAARQRLGHPIAIHRWELNENGASTG